MSKKNQTDEKFELQDFDLFLALAAIDKKDYSYFSRLSEEQQKKFVPYLLVCYSSAVHGSSDLQKYYLNSVNYHANTHLFNEKIVEHPELVWYMLCAASPGMGKQFHKWIPQLSSKTGNLKQPMSEKDVISYLKKVSPGADDTTVKNSAREFTDTHNHRVAVAEIFSTLKLEDLHLLAELISTEELDEYQSQLGNY